MKPMLLLLILSSFLINAFSQSNVLFEETFSDNSKNWKEYNDTNFLVQVNNGALNIQKHGKNRIKNGCLWYSKEIPGFNTLSNFNITFYAKIISADDVINLIDFEWGFNNTTRKNIRLEDSIYQVNFIMNGQTSLNYFDKGWHYLYRLESKVIKKNELNKYEIIQQEDNCIIKINDVVVLKKPIHRIYGNSIGIQQCLKSSWMIDRIIIKQDKYL